jgi:glucans biosynthesis protein
MPQTSAARVRGAALVRSAAGRLVCVLVLAPSLAMAAAPEAGFGFESVRALARELAAGPYQDPERDEKKIPDFLLELDYDAHRDIRFKPARSIWRDEKLPFQLQLFHLGLFFNRPVAIHLVEDGKARPFDFDASLFDYGRNQFPEPLPPDLGYAGFRVHSRINRNDYFDEVIVFVGASYFRAVAKGLRYGLSARGIAIDTAGDGSEEFPYFKAFWIERPAPRAKQIVVYALLDGPSLTGAYRFEVAPGTQTVAAVQASVYARSQGQGRGAIETRRLGLAPLTSMFWHAENSETDFGDFRPRVHDSDGLLMHAGSGEWIWRPLRNPMTLAVSAFQDRNPRGFGLLQRERDFTVFQDLEAHHEERPSAWVEPVGEWGEGHVVLVEVPSDLETNDNIVAFWEPRLRPKPGEAFDFAYKLYWYADDPSRPPRARALATRVGAIRESEETRFVVDFGKGELAKLGADAAITADVSASGGGVVHDVVTQFNPYIRGWRVAFRLASEDPDEAIELRCFLSLDGRALTETWSYRWNP